MRLTESQLRNIIFQTIKENIIHNPADNYSVDYQEAVQKCRDILPSLNSFNQYINGIEEDIDNGIDGKEGISYNMKLKGMWNSDEDEMYYADELNKMSRDIRRAISTINEFIEFAENR